MFLLLLLEMADLWFSTTTWFAYQNSNKMILLLIYASFASIQMNIRSNNKHVWIRTLILFHESAKDLLVQWIARLYDEESLRNVF